MSDYAIGKNALGLCDRCGWTYKLKELKYQYENLEKTGLRVCPTCLDVDHPQLRLSDLDPRDPQGLLDPRIDIGRVESTSLAGWNPLYGIEMIIELGTVKVS